MCLSNEYSGLISFRIDWLDLLLSKGLSKVFSSCLIINCLCPWYSVHKVISHPDRHSKHASKRLDRWKLRRKDVCLWGYSEDCVLRDWSGPLSAIWRELPEKERTCEEMSAEIGMEVESVKAWQKWGCHLHIWIPTCLKPAIFLGFWLMNTFLFQFDFYHLRPKDSWPFVPNFICFLPVAFLPYKIPFLFWLALLMEFFTVCIKSVDVFTILKFQDSVCLTACLKSGVWHGAGMYNRCSTKICFLKERCREVNTISRVFSQSFYELRMSKATPTSPGAVWSCVMITALPYFLFCIPGFIFSPIHLPEKSDLMNIWCP